MPIPTLWLICGSLTFLAGALVVLGWRGRRVGDHRYCRRCGYDLFGCGPTTTACPECGADLARRRAVHVGQPKLWWKMLCLGTLLLVFAGGIVGTDYWLHSKGRTWYSIAPEWLLIQVAKRTDDQIVVRELGLRLIKGELSPSNHFKFFELLAEKLNRVLELKSEPLGRHSPWNAKPAGTVFGGLLGSPYDPFLDEKMFLSALAEHGHIPTIRWRQLLAEHVAAGFRVREKAGRNRPVVLVQPEWTSKIAHIELKNNAVLVDIRYMNEGQLQRYTQARWHPEYGLYHGEQVPSLEPLFSMPSTWHTMPVKLPPGKYILQFPSTDWQAWSAFSHFRTPFTVPSRDFHIEVVDDETTVELVTDDRLAKAFHDFWVGLGSDYYWYRLSEIVVEPQCSLVYDIFVRASGHETRVATIVCSSKHTSIMNETSLPHPIPGTIDLVFRPNIEAAEETPHIYRILGNEIVVENVSSDRMIEPLLRRLSNTPAPQENAAGSEQ